METIYGVVLIKHTDCDECDGTGHHIHIEGDTELGIPKGARMECSDCLGRGRIQEEEEVPLAVLEILLSKERI